MQSDHHYGEATDNALSQGNNIYWAPGDPSAAVIHFEYPSLDPISFHHTTTYDPTGYTNADAQHGLPLGSQHQQDVVLIRCSDSFDHHYDTVTQHPQPWCTT